MLPRTLEEAWFWAVAVFNTAIAVFKSMSPGWSPVVFPGMHALWLMNSSMPKMSVNIIRNDLLLNIFYHTRILIGCQCGFHCPGEKIPVIIISLICDYH